MVAPVPTMLMPVEQPWAWIWSMGMCRTATKMESEVCTHAEPLGLWNQGMCRAGGRSLCWSWGSTAAAPSGGRGNRVSLPGCSTEVIPLLMSVASAPGVLCGAAGWGPHDRHYRILHRERCVESALLRELLRSSVAKATGVLCRTCHWGL